MHLTFHKFMVFSAVLGIKEDKNRKECFFFFNIKETIKRFWQLGHFVLRILIRVIFCCCGGVGTFKKACISSTTINRTIPEGRYNYTCEKYLSRLVKICCWASFHRLHILYLHEGNRIESYAMRRQDPCYVNIS